MIGLNRMGFRRHSFWICCASVHLSQRLSGDLDLGRMFKYAALVGAPPYSHYWFLLLARFNVGPTTRCATYPHRIIGQGRRGCCPR